MAGLKIGSGGRSLYHLSGIILTDNSQRRKQKWQNSIPEYHWLSPPLKELSVLIASISTDSTCQLLGHPTLELFNVFGLNLVW